MKRRNRVKWRAGEKGRAVTGRGPWGEMAGHGHGRAARAGGCRRAQGAGGLSSPGGSGPSRSLGGGRVVIIGWRPPVSYSVAFFCGPLCAWHWAGHRAPLSALSMGAGGVGSGDLAAVRHPEETDCRLWAAGTLLASPPGASAAPFSEDFRGRDIATSHEALSVLMCSSLAPREALRGEVGAPTQEGSPHTVPAPGKDGDREEGSAAAAAQPGGGSSQSSPPCLNSFCSERGL